MAEGSLQLSSMPWVSVTKRVLHILDLFDSDPDVGGLVCSGVKAMDVNICTHIFFIALQDLEFTVLLQAWTQEGRHGGFLGQHAS